MCARVCVILHNKWKPSRLHAINWDSARKRAKSEPWPKVLLFSLHCIHLSIRRTSCLVNFFFAALACTDFFLRRSIIYSIWITKIPKLESVNQCGRFNVLCHRKRFIHTKSLLTQWVSHSFSWAFLCVLWKMRINAKSEARSVNIERWTW